MPVPVSWPVIGGTPYSIPVTGETNWGTLTNYLVALATAQGTTAQKVGARVATSTPVTVISATDAAVVVNLTVPGPSVVQLPPGVNGQLFNISDGKGDAGVNNITILPNGTDTINNGPSFVINSNNDAIGLIFTASSNNWKVTSQILSFTPGSVARNAIQAGTPDYVVINAPVTGLLSEEQFLNQIRGGFGANVSNFTGVVKAAVGSFSASPIVNADVDANANIDATKLGTGTVNNAEFNRVPEMGRYAATTKITGGVGSINGGNPALFDLTGGTGQIIDYVADPLEPNYTDVVWPNFTAQTITNLATADITYLLINSAGALIQQTSFPTPAQQRQNIFLSRINHSSRVTIQFVDNIGGDSASAPNQLMDLFDALGPFNVDGNTVSANGANLNINKALGSMFSRYFNQVATPLNPHVVTNASLIAASFFYQTQTATVGVSTIAIQPGNYDVAGVVTPVPGGISTSTIQRVFLFPSNNVRIQYGQTTYANLADAVAAVTTDPFVINPTNVGFPILIGFIVMRRDASQLNNPAQARFLPASRFSTGAAGASGGTTTLQGAYNNSSVPILTLSALVGAFNVRDNAAPLVGSLFNVQNNAAGVSYIDVSVQGIKSNQYPAANRVMITDVNSAASQSAVTSTELGYLSGTTGVTGTGNLVRSVGPTLTGPIIDGGTVIAGPTSPRITVPKNTYANLLLATRVEGTILYATDLDLFFADDGIALSPIGSGGSLNTNMIANPNNATGWSRTGSVFAVPVTTTTAGDLPLGGIVSSAIQLVATGSGAETAEYVSYTVTTPTTFGGKLQINFFQKPGTGFVSGQWTLSVYQGSTRQSLSSDSGGVTLIPNVNGPFTVSMDAIASTTYTLRFARTSGAGSATLNIANVFFGFPFITQGAAVSEWQSYTPTVSAGLGGQSGFEFWYKRDGSDVLLKGGGLFTSTAGTAMTLSMPAGLTISTATVQASSRGMVGKFVIGTGTAFISSTDKEGILFSDDSDTSNLFWAIQTSSTGLTKNQGSQIIATASGWFSIEARVAVAEWAGNGTVNLGPGAQVEYAYFTGTVDANGNTNGSNSTSGPSGAQMSALSTTRNKYVTWQYPPQNGDLITAQVSVDSGQSWSDSVAPYIETGTATTAQGVSYVSTSAAGVSRFDIGRYVSATNAWASSYYIRFVKVKPSSPVGFGLATTDGSAGLYKPGQAPGLATGAAIPAGYVGEILSSTTTTAITTVPTNLASLPLTPGVWTVSGGCRVTADTSGRYVAVSISTTSATSDTVLGRMTIADYSTANGLVAPMTFPRTINVSTSTTVYLVGVTSSVSGLSATNSYIEAVRIA